MDFMKKSKELFSDEDDMEDGIWVKDEGLEALEAMEAMTGFLRAQHEGALELTKLVLGHCKNDNWTKEKIFIIFQDATKMMVKNAKSLMETN